MRNVKWLVTAVLVASTTGCVESVNQGYGYNGGGYGYGNSYGYNSGYGNGYSSTYYPSSSGYYSRPAPVNNYYYNSRPAVVTQTRYVPVPTPVPVPSRQPDRSNDHRWGGQDNDHRWGSRDNDNHHHYQSHPDRPNTPPTQAQNNNRPTPASGTGGNRRDWDRDGDGKPDRRG